MSDQGYNTNLTAEFFVLSSLHRLGANALITLGNKKGVDISVVRSPGDSISIDVKGLAGKTSWPVDNVKELPNGHFLAFVCYHGEIANPSIPPEIWIIPAPALPEFIYQAPGGRKVVPRSGLIQRGEQYAHAWHLLC
ncbi:hypothetical protein [Permianibacter aggregans]|uniref:PD(D/E)XK endonuclease domain-containing protein n=1 Tax=Permianibacter aggregans TaxID=1510150 RepID=A0A4R6UJD7_9GAMM|nr:hypothetical protein [Permianibacter aggregans]QGX38425.1 hypothetical protein E2H98_01585 [Permianibacter aggregans]TDQ45539.1 hypothetical protein EV696_1197 [Permianibacter aggregans]